MPGCNRDSAGAGWASSRASNHLAIGGIGHVAAWPCITGPCRGRRPATISGSFVCEGSRQDCLGDQAAMAPLDFEGWACVVHRTSSSHLWEYAASNVACLRRFRHPGLCSTASCAICLSLACCGSVCCSKRQAGTSLPSSETKMDLGGRGSFHEGEGVTAVHDLDSQHRYGCNTGVVLRVQEQG